MYKVNAVNIDNPVIMVTHSQKRRFSPKYEFRSIKAATRNLEIQIVFHYFMSTS